MSTVNGVLIFNEIDRLHPVDLSYDMWDIEIEKLNEHYLAREAIGTSVLDAYNVDASLAGFLSNALLFRNQYYTLELDNWAEIAKRFGFATTGNLTTDTVFAINTLAAYQSNNEAMGTPQMQLDVKRALRIALTLVPYLSIPTALSWDQFNAPSYFTAEDGTVEEIAKMRSMRIRQNNMSRRKVGIAEFDMPNLSSHLATVFAVMLDRLAEVGHGAPYKVNFAEWKQILKRMALLASTLENDTDDRLEFIDLVVGYFFHLWD